MAKRKAARPTRRATASRATAAGRRGAGTKKKAAPKRKPRAGSSTRTAKRTAKAGTRKSGTARKATKAARTTRKQARTTSRQPRTTGKPARAASRQPRTTGKQPRAASNTAPRRTAPPQAARPKAPVVTSRSAPAGAKPSVVVRKSPNLDRARRVVTDDEDIVQTPPSSLDLDRSASAARSGRKSLLDRYEEHTETSPAITAGDVDADWESAYSVGDEAPGGDNPTPDQDIVDDIGRAVGIEYQDNEELKGADKVEKRDRKRWELDPASSEDWEDR